MYFSLKCGSVFETYDNSKEMEFQRIILILQAIKNSTSDSDESKDASKMINEFLNEKNISEEEFLNLIARVKKKKRCIEDSIQEENKKIYQVLNVHPGVELMHFCINEEMRSYWKTLDMCNHRMGEVLFWKFIVPKFCEIQKLVGCEYAFLFAADYSENGELVNYYETVLKFKKNNDVGTNKPYYDLMCSFMCQEVNQMIMNMDYFFNNFNLDDDDAI